PAPPARHDLDGQDHPAAFRRRARLRGAVHDPQGNPRYRGVARSVEPATMNATNLFMCALAGVVLLAVVMRLAALKCSGQSLRCRVTWHLWVLGQVEIAEGAVAVMVGWP